MRSNRESPLTGHGTRQKIVSYGTGQRHHQIFILKDHTLPIKNKTNTNNVQLSSVNTTPTIYYENLLRFLILVYCLVFAGDFSCGWSPHFCKKLIVEATVDFSMDMLFHKLYQSLQVLKIERC